MFDLAVKWSKATNDNKIDNHVSTDCIENVIVAVPIHLLRRGIVMFQKDIDLQVLYIMFHLIFILTLNCFYIKLCLAQRSLNFLRKGHIRSIQTLSGSDRKFLNYNSQKKY